MPIFSAILTLAILMFSEIVPKTFGAVHWRALWPHVAWPLIAIQRLLRPLVWLTRKFSNLLVSDQTESRTTEDEVLAMIRQAASSGEVSPLELKLLTAVFSFDKVTCREVMVPRNEVAFFKKGWLLKDSLSYACKTLHTRYPVCVNTFDAPIGIVHLKDLLSLDESSAVETVARTARSVPETMPIPRLLREIGWTDRSRKRARAERRLFRYK